MVTSALHAIYIDGLRHSDPSFYKEYCLLIDGVSSQIRYLAKKYADTLDYTSFTEGFNKSSNEPVLQIVVGANRTELSLHVFIRKDKQFAIGKSGNVVIASNAAHALEIISKEFEAIEL